MIKRIEALMIKTAGTMLVSITGMIFPAIWITR